MQTWPCNLYEDDDNLYEDDAGKQILMQVSEGDTIAHKVICSASPSLPSSQSGSAFQTTQFHDAS